jgi:hypothetical protein
MAFSTWIDSITSRPRLLFLIDGLGALLTALMIGGVQVQWAAYIGLPLSVLYLLAGLALVFCAYSLTCHFLLGRRWRPFLLAIMIANTSYCLLTLSLMIYHADSVTLLGWVYYLVEIVIVGVLVWLEKTAYLKNQ